MRAFFQKNPLEGDGNAGVNIILSLVKDIRKETQYFRSERQKIRKAYDVQEAIRKAERDKVIKEQSGKLEVAAGALEEVRAQAKSKAGAIARSSKNGQQELIEQFDRVQRQNTSLSDTIVGHVEKATKLTTKAAQQGLTTAKFKQHAVVTTDGQGQQVATQAEMEAMRDELRVGMEQVRNDLGQQIKSVSHAHMDAMERFALQTAQMVARENGTVAERVEQCIEY
jgi:3-deoxy-D-manno-octulosonic-acid transferase